MKETIHITKVWHGRHLFKKNQALSDKKKTLEVQLSLCKRGHKGTDIIAPERAWLHIAGHGILISLIELEISLIEFKMSSTQCKLSSTQLITLSI